MKSKLWKHSYDVDLNNVTKLKLKDMSGFIEVFM
jgi:hypothetical protein